MKREWSVRTYVDGDENGIYDLYKTVYPFKQYDRDLWLKRWRWIYKNNPAGPSQIWVADHKGRIVGQYPIIFMQMKVDNEILTVSQNIDLMTHPDYTHQGMFTTLEREALNELSRQGVHITIGFPNKAAYPGHKKSGWFNISTRLIMLKPLSWKNALGLKLKSGPLVDFLAVGATLVFDKIIFRTHEAPAVDGLTEVGCQ